MNHILESVINCVTANSEEDLLPVLNALSEPANTKEEMGSMLNELLGYNPLTVHDTETLTMLFERTLDNADETLKDEIVASKDAIIQEALDNYNSYNEEMLSRALAKSLEDRYDWVPEFLLAESFEIDDAVEDEEFGEIDDDEDED